MKNRTTEKRKLLSLKNLMLLVWIFSVGSFQEAMATSKEGTLGDRLVFSVNNVPYTQLQIEGYMNVKETLRQDVQNSQVVNSTNWNVALAAFMLDMTLYQEATKSSGFRPQREGIQKAVTLVSKSLDKSTSFRTRFIQLGLNEIAIREHLSRILTIENLRRSRQGVDKKSLNSSTSWEAEIQKSAMIRWFDHGKEYQNISPL